MRYALLSKLPESLAGLQTTEPRRLADGTWLVKWADEGERPELAALPNKYQRGIAYWFIPRRKWYTTSEIERRLAEEPPGRMPP